jgi:hypothetical protein
MPDSKHLEFLQAAISRMAGNSFVTKGWSITLTTATLGVAVQEGDHVFALIGLLPVLLFWILDGYYLGLERAFIGRFKSAADDYRNSRAPDFQMSPSMTSGERLVALFRPAVLLVHLPLAAVLVIGWGVLRHGA